MIAASARLICYCESFAIIFWLGSQEAESDRKSPLPACPFERSGDAHRAWLRPMGVSASLDTNGKREWQQTTDCGRDDPPCREDRKRFREGKNGSVRLRVGGCR